MPHCTSLSTNWRQRWHNSSPSSPQEGSDSSSNTSGLHIWTKFPLLNYISLLLYWWVFNDNLLWWGILKFNAKQGSLPDRSQKDQTDVTKAVLSAAIQFATGLTNPKAQIRHTLSWNLFQTAAWAARKKSNMSLKVLLLGQRETKLRGVHCVFGLNEACGPAPWYITMGEQQEGSLVAPAPTWCGGSGGHRSP